MQRIKESELKEKIDNVDFNGKTYFVVTQAQEYLKADLTGIESLLLPVNNQQTACADFDNIFKAKKDNRQLGDFDKKIIQAINFNPKSK